jgi:hypothetical protein
MAEPNRVNELLLRRLVDQRIKMRPGPYTTLANQITGSDTYHRHYTNVVAPEDPTIEVSLQVQACPAVYTDCLQR